MDRLVAMRAAELVDLGAEEVDVTAASFVRGLIRREAKAKGLMPAAAAPPAVAKVEATTTPAEEPATALAPTPDPKALKERRGDADWIVLALAVVILVVSVVALVIVLKG